MQPSRPIMIAAGAVLTAALAVIGARSSADTISSSLSHAAKAAIAQAGGRGVTADFKTSGGSPTRHPLLHGGEKLDEGTRLRVARAVANVPGVGAIRWSDGPSLASGTQGQPAAPLHCQEDVEALLRARTIRFEESSAAMASASQQLVDEVATALRPCLGAIIAINGHTDSSGNEPGNLFLSQERADAVKQALIARGIPADGLRARGLGSAQPVAGLDPADPANRRIDFSVIATMPIKPTPVDKPGPR
ncbi:MAG: OmpA family protein [Novosphingobium sp.]|nr:OmpA family protein [Novosphingobium sp.]